MKKSAFFNNLRIIFVFFIKKTFSGYWESSEYIKKKNISEKFFAELADVNHKRTKYAVLFVLLLLTYSLVTDLVPSRLWTNEQRYNYLIVDSIFFAVILILALLTFIKFSSDDEQNKRFIKKLITHILISGLILWSTAISSVETIEINYFVTYIITIIAISFFFHIRSFTHIAYLIFGFLLLKFHFSWNNTFNNTQDGGYYEIVLIMSVMTFIISRILIISRMNGFSAHHKLVELTDSLDKKVNEKTKELTQANKELEYEIEIRKRYQDNLTEAKRRAEESDRLKSTFLANMSHEIRTPMNGILGFSELLSKRDLGLEKTQKYLKLIYSNSKQLLVIIDDILDISKIEANQLKVYPEETEVNKILIDTQEFFSEIKKQMGKESISINLEISQNNNNHTIYADPIRLSQVLTNLIKNALKFTDEGSIDLGYKPEKNETLFYVKDSGIGIPKSKIEFIFNRFNQISNTEANNKGGTGLGLTISKGLIELMGGDIWCESEVDEGSTFYFTLPNSRAYLNKRFNIDLISYQGKKLLSDTTVLIVDDNLSSFNLIKEFLTQYNVNVIHAVSGKDAIEKCIQEAEIAVVIMELLLNKKEGNKAIDLIRKCRNDLPVIAQTSNTKHLGNAKIWDDIILKPIKEMDLITTLVRNIPTN